LPSSLLLGYRANRNCDVIAPVLFMGCNNLTPSLNQSID
jgi:hypothetical protein